MKQIKRIAYAIALGLAFTSSAMADTFTTNTETVLINASGGMGGGGCPGGFAGLARFTNSVGTFSLTPPAHVVSGTFSFVSGVTPDPKVNVSSGLAFWCDTNSVAFPAATNKTYIAVSYIRGTPTNGQPVTLQLVWRTNP